MVPSILLYLSFCFTNALIYTFVKYFAINNHGLNTTLVMFYTNTVSMTIMLPYFFANFKKVISGFKSNSKLILSSPAGILKILAIQHISPKNAFTVGFLNPFFVMLMSFIFLKEFDKKNLKSMAWMLLSLFGAVIFIGVDSISFNSFWYLVMVAHVVLKSLIHVFYKQLSKDKFVALFYAVFFNLFYTFMLIKYRGYSIDLSYSLNWQVISIGTISVLCQFALIYAYKKANKISLLQNFDFSRVIFASVISYYLLGDTFNLRQCLGMLVIFISMFIGRKYAKKAS